MIAYNIPSRVVVNMPPDLMAELATIDNVVAVKQASNDEIGPIEGMEVLAGNNESFLQCLETGGQGGVLVASHVVGRQMRAIYDAVKAGDMARAREIDESLRTVYAALTVAINPIPVKAAVEMMGLRSGRMRLPMVELDEEHRSVVRRAMENFVSV